MLPLFGIASRIYRSIKPVRSEAYLKYVRSWPCIACGTMRKRRDAAHTGPHSQNCKATDLDCIPACRPCHQELHRLGPVRFQLKHDLDFGMAIEALQKFYTIKFGRLPGEGERAA